MPEAGLPGRFAGSPGSAGRWLAPASVSSITRELYAGPRVPRGRTPGGRIVSPGRRCRGSRHRSRRRACERLGRHPLLSACAPPPPARRARRDARARRRGRRRPPRVPATHCGAPVTRSAALEHRAGDARVGVGLHRRTRHDRRDAGRPRRLEGAREFDGRVGVARKGASLHDEHALVGDGRGIRAALDRGDSNTRCEQRMARPRADLGAEFASATRPSTARSIASTPKPGCDPVPRPPRIRPGTRAKPRCASVTSRSVGSSTTAWSGRPDLSRAREEFLHADGTEFLVGEGEEDVPAQVARRAAAAATIAAASPPAMSYAPRLTMRSATTSGAPSAPAPGPPTVSRCPARSSPLPQPPAPAAARDTGPRGIGPDDGTRAPARRATRRWSRRARARPRRPERATVRRVDRDETAVRPTTSSAAAVGSGTVCGRLTPRRGTAGRSRRGSARACP